MSNIELDQEISETLTRSGAIAPSRVPGRGRSVRPGANALRRMTVARLVREYRTERVNRSRSGDDRTDWRALAEELERRELPASARVVREEGSPDVAGEVLTVMAAVSVGVISAAQRDQWGEDRELDELERVVEQRSSELGADDLSAELERDTTVLAEAEYLADLEEVSADTAMIDAEAFAADVAGDDPAAAMIPDVEAVATRESSVEATVESTSEDTATL